MPSKKLLIADDSLTIQKVIKLALSNDEYEIQAVSDGNDAIQQIALFRPDVVLIDVSLPGKSAIEVKKSAHAQAEFKQTRFILMSSVFEKVDEIQLREASFHGHLTKPFDPTQLRKVLTDALATATLSQDSTEEIEYDSKMDIKKMTEETIELAGTEDFPWTIEEKGLKAMPFENVPVVPPPPAFHDFEEVSFDLALTPPPPPAPFPPPPLFSSPAMSPEDNNVLPLTTAQMEELLKNQLQNTLEKMAQKILPDLAEKVIKQEIHRMLKEQP